MKQYKDTKELAFSDETISITFKERIFIGQMQFEIYMYVVVEDDDTRVLFGCFHITDEPSPVFDLMTNVLRYAINVYNEKLICVGVNGKNILGNPVKNGKRGK